MFGIRSRIYPIFSKFEFDQNQFKRPFFFVYPTVRLPQMRPKNASIEDGKRQPAHVELYAGSTNNYEVKTNSFKTTI
jgi:hypothetical protein